MVEISIEDGVLRVGDATYFLRNVSSVRVEEVNKAAVYETRPEFNMQMGCVVPLLAFILGFIFMSALIWLSIFFIFIAVIFFLIGLAGSKTVEVSPEVHGFTLVLDTNSGLQQVVTSDDKDELLALAKRIEAGVARL